MNDLDRKVGQILVESLEREFPGTTWVIRPSTRDERRAAQQRSGRPDGDECGEADDGA